MVFNPCIITLKLTTPFQLLSNYYIYLIIFYPVNLHTSLTCIINNKMLKQFYVFRKMKNMYQILKPATFIQLAAESFQIILQPCVILKVYVLLLQKCFVLY